MPDVQVIPTCQRCGAPRLAYVLARRSDMCTVDLAGKHRSGYVHRSAFVDAYDALDHNDVVFYPGIKVHDTQVSTLYRYCILGKATLTEDRTLCERPVETSSLHATKRKMMMPRVVVRGTVAVSSP